MRSHTDIDLTVMSAITRPLWLAPAHTRRRTRRIRTLVAVVMIAGLVLTFAFMGLHLERIAVP